jgi:hypothetical protein
MPQGWDERGRDMRSLSERQDDELMRPTSRRFCLLAFGIAFAIGLISGVVLIVVRLWRFYVSPFF